MTNDSNNPLDDQMLELADAVFNGSASAEEVQQLELILNNNPQVRKKYLRYALLHGQLSLTIPELPPQKSESVDRPVSSVNSPFSTLDRKQTRHRQFLFRGVCVAVVAIAVMIAWLPDADHPPQQDALKIVQHNLPLDAQPNTQFDAPMHVPQIDEAPDSSHYDNRLLPIHTVANISITASTDNSPTNSPNQSGSTSPLTLEVKQGETQFQSESGASVFIEGPAMFGVNSPDGGVLYRGSVRARVEDPDASFSVLTSNLRFVDLGTEFRVTIMDDNHVKLHVLDGEVEVQSRIRLPLFYWNFDTIAKSSSQNNFPDLIKGIPVSLEGSVKPITGIIGTGGLSFDNSLTSQVRINGGTGNKVGTGSFACSSGITIEAVFISNWSAEYRDYDEIFRKEDGLHRILLSFQNDDNKKNNYDIPKVEPGPCLSFGLHLKEHGYSELDMPLDGRDGRPTVADLTDGKPHHVVATYNSFTGHKAIYIDGQLRFEHTFPKGTLILSGGPTSAVIGNHIKREPFNGIIDEVAFYDFAITPKEIAEHARNFSLGKTYFGSMTNQLQSTRWQSVTRVTEGQVRIFNQVTGLPINDDAEIFLEKSF